MYFSWYRGKQPELCMGFSLCLRSPSNSELTSELNLQEQGCQGTCPPWALWNRPSLLLQPNKEVHDPHFPHPAYSQQTVVVMVIPVLYKPFSAYGTDVRMKRGRLALTLGDGQTPITVFYSPRGTEQATSHISHFK